MWFHWVVYDNKVVMRTDETDMDMHVNFRIGVLVERQIFANDSGVFRYPAFYA